MHEQAPRTGAAAKFFCAKRSFVEIDGTPSASHYQVRSNRVIPLRNRFHLSSHRFLLFFESLKSLALRGRESLRDSKTVTRNWSNSQRSGSALYTAYTNHSRVRTLSDVYHR